jgi:two-component system sensor histidine kinase QseC
VGQAGNTACGAGIIKAPRRFILPKACPMFRRLITWLNRSIHRRLLALLALGLPLLWLASAGLAYMTARYEVNELFDTEQVLFAQFLASVDLRARQAGAEILPHRPQEIKDLFDDDHSGGEIDADDFAFQLRDAQGHLRLSDVRQTPLPARMDYTGFADVKIDKTVWRVYYLNDRARDLSIAVGQKLKERTSLARVLTLGQLTPWLLTMPLVLGWIWWGVRQGLRPLRSLTDQIASQQPTRLTPLAAGQVPDEIAPLVHALNALLARLDEALDSERRFTADAAHELRTPLAALRVQVEVAQLANGPEARRKALGQVLAGIDRATRLVSQLLTLARLDHNPQALAGDAELVALARQHLLDASDDATARNVRCEWPDSLPIWPHPVNPALLDVLLRNLVDNAVRYTPAGGRVWLEDAGQGWLTLANDAPETLDAETLARLGERFFRPAGQSASGSGLGLSIARRAARLCGLELSLSLRDGVFRAHLRTSTTRLASRG